MVRKRESILISHLKMDPRLREDDGVVSFFSLMLSCAKNSQTILENLNMNKTEFIGYISAFLTTFAFVPQALHSWKTRDLSGVSLPMYSMFSIGVAGWIIYGVSIASWPVVAANVVTLVLSCAVLWLKLKHR